MVHSFNHLLVIYYVISMVGLHQDKGTSYLRVFNPGWGDETYTQEQYCRQCALLELVVGWGRRVKLWRVRNGSGFKG